MTHPIVRRAALAAAIALAGGTAAAPALAHHGWSGYESAATVTLTGTVQSIAYRNPHAALMLQADGKTWEIVLAPISRMAARGIPEGAIKAGDTVTVAGYVHRDHPTELRAETITVAGNTVPLR